MLKEKQNLISFVESTVRDLIDCQLVDDSMTRKGKTQNSSQHSEDLASTVFSLARDEGLIEDFVKASSQKPYDIRYSLPSETLGPISKKDLECTPHLLENIPDNLGLFEVKKTESGTIMLNDTIPHPSSHYLLFVLQPKNKVIQLFSGESIINALNTKLKKSKEPCPFKDVYEYREHINNLRKMTGFATRGNLVFHHKDVSSPIFTINLKKLSPRNPLTPADSMV